MATQEDDSLQRLQQLGDLIQASIADYVKLKQSSVEDVEAGLPEKPLFDAQRTLLAAAGLLTELVSQPSNRLLEVSSQYFEARALHIVADKRIPDILAQSGDAGVAIISLSSAVGIESRKLCKWLVIMTGRKTVGTQEFRLEYEQLGHPETTIITNMV